MPRFPITLLLEKSTRFLRFPVLVDAKSPQFAARPILLGELIEGQNFSVRCTGAWICIQNVIRRKRPLFAGAVGAFSKDALPRAFVCRTRMRVSDPLTI